jgi:PAS domain S-box-containing protein
LKSPERSDKLTFGLRSQLLLIVSSMLIVEVGIFTGLQVLLNQAERESKLLDRARANLDLSNRLIEQIYLIARTGQSFLSHHEPKDWRQCLAARNEATALQSKLQQQSQDSPQEFELVKKLGENMRDTMAAADRAIYLNQHGLTDEGEKPIARVKELSHQLNIDLVAFCRAQREVEMTSPEKERLARHQAKLLLLAGVVLNVILALVLALFFIRNVTNRLQGLVDNTRRLSRGLPLNPSLSGKDEIAELDRVFHEMADQLQKESNLLRTSEAQVRNIIERMPAGLVILKSDSTIEFANPYITKILGYQQSEIRNLPLAKLIQSKGGQSGDELLAQARSAQPGSIMEVTALDKKKHPHQLELSFGEFSTTEGKRELATLIDVSERHEIQKLRQAFVSMVSHELRTPLTSVKGYLSLIEMGALGETSDQLKDGAKVSERNINRLINLINELLDLEKLEAGQLVVKKSSTLVKAIFDHATDSVKGFANERGVTIESIDNTHCRIDVDSSRIAQVLINLLSNAIKFSSSGSKVVARATELAHFVEFSVEDSGPGIDEKYHNSIFERFQQVGETGNKPKEGTGLGLAISKAIVEDHGGTIGIKSDPGCGSCFWFKLPKA